MWTRELDEIQKKHQQTLQNLRQADQLRIRIQTQDKQTVFGFIQKFIRVT